MPEKLDNLLEDGFLGALAFILTAGLTFVGIHVKGNKEFRLQVFKKIDRNDVRINEKLDDHKDQVSKTHPTNNEFQMLLEMVRGIDDYIKQDRQN